MVQAILSLAEAFQLEAIVEGVETGSQLDKVTAMGAELVQGYYYSKPIPAEEVDGYIRCFRGPKNE